MFSSELVSLIQETLLFFLSTMAELAVLFVGISFLVGVLNEFMPQEKLKRWLSGRNGRGYLIGSVLGGLTPFCSCSTIPVTVGLLRAKAGFGPTMAFLFTSPLVNPIIIPLFITLLGLKVTLVYAVVAITLSIGISFTLNRMGFAKYIKGNVFENTREDTDLRSDMAPSGQTLSCCAKKPQLQMVQLQALEPCCGTSESAPSSNRQGPMMTSVTLRPNRWRRIFGDGVAQFKNLLPFIVLGVAIGSIIHGFLPTDIVVRLAGADNPLAVPAAAVIGIPLYLRVSTMVPIAASLIAKGMSTGAVIALIVGGAGASLPEVAMLKGIFRTQLLAAFLASVMIMAITTGFLVNLVLL